LIFLNVALFFFIFKFERKWRTEEAGREARRRVLGPEAADIRFLQVKSTAATGSFTLVRQRDSWSLTAPLDWPANPHAASTIVNELQLLEHETSFAVADLAKNNLSLTDYGLDKPKVTVEFTSRDPATPGLTGRGTTVLQIGDMTKDGKRLYILSPDRERVHIVNRSLLDSLSIPPEQLRADTLLSVRVFEARSLSIVQTASPDPARAAAPGVRVRIRKDGTRWRFESPHTALASKTAVEVAINDLNALRARAFPSPAPSPATAPLLRITLEGNSRHETLFIGEPVRAAAAPAGAPTPPAAGAAPTPAPAPPATPPDTVEHYAQLEGRSTVFTLAIPAKLLSDLRNAQKDLRETRILDFDAAAVSKIDLASPMQPNQPPVTLQRLELPAGQTTAAAAPWQVVRRGEGTQGPQTLPADRGAVQRLLEQLTLLTARTFKSDAPTSADLEDWGFNRPLREVTLTLAGNTPPVVLRIGTDANRTAYYARVGTPADPGTSIYEIGAEFEPELQLSTLAWRDRAVTDPLPAAARITALKLTDLETRQVVFETTFNPAGEPATPPRDPKALAGVIAALRAPRAKAFVPGGYSDRVTAAGDERPWRFQLEAALVVPGLGGVEQPGASVWTLTERLGGNQQFAGVKDLDLVFALEQPLVDALWALTYGARDPGPRVEQKR
ncbi:MAG: DUF4340 domain-containing protein, partial [Opitutaceae bacterium]|nr:DUF4340 domain-containing protein [Opitutaceae bacterium]